MNGKDETHLLEESVKVLVPAAVVTLPSPTVYWLYVQADLQILLLLLPLYVSKFSLGHLANPLLTYAI